MGQGAAAALVAQVEPVWIAIPLVVALIIPVVLARSARTAPLAAPARWAMAAREVSVTRVVSAYPAPPAPGEVAVRVEIQEAPDAFSVLGARRETTSPAAAMARPRQPSVTFPFSDRCHGRAAIAPDVLLAANKYARRR